MPYSYAHFAKDVLDELDVVVPEAMQDNPIAQAVLALSAIKKLVPAGVQIERERINRLLDRAEELIRVDERK